MALMLFIHNTYTTPSYTHTHAQAVNPDMFVDFGAEPDGPVLAHEMR